MQKVTDPRFFTIYEIKKAEEVLPQLRLDESNEMVYEIG